MSGGAVGSWRRGSTDAGRPEAPAGHQRFGKFPRLASHSARPAQTPAEPRGRHRIRILAGRAGCRRGALQTLGQIVQQINLRCRGWLVPHLPARPRPGAAAARTDSACRSFRPPPESPTASYTPCALRLSPSGRPAGARPSAAPCASVRPPRPSAKPPGCDLFDIQILRFYKPAGDSASRGSGANRR